MVKPSDMIAAGSSKGGKSKYRNNNLIQADRDRDSIGKVGMLLLNGSSARKEKP